MSTITELKWSFLTPTINEMKSPNSHFARTLFGKHQTLPTETVEISVLNQGRKMAPFVKKNGEAQIVTGSTADYWTVEAPNIRIKEPFTPSELLFNRRPGTTIFQQGDGTIKRAIREHIRRDLQVMRDYVANSEEWMCALALQGTITYSVANEDVFTITYPKPSGHNITLGTFWDDATPAGVDISSNVMAVKRLMADYGLHPSACYLGEEASDAFQALLEAKSTLDRRFIAAGRLDQTRQFDENGVIFLGTFMGIRMYEYSRTVTNSSGTSVDMVRTKYAEFVPQGQRSDWVTYYGAIPDIKVLRGRKLQQEIFVKSWEEEDPSVFIALAHSRPLPVPRRPWNVSVKVVSG